jgi:phosphonatase-like hydrolase
MVDHHIRLVVFDLAGTTVRDDGQVPSAFTTAMLAHGIEVTPAQLVTVRGASKREAIRRFVTGRPEPEAIAAAAYDTFREHLAAAYAAGVRAVEGAEAVVRALRRDGVRVGLNTGFDRDTTDLLLDALGWRTIADAVVCGDDVAHGRPAPDLILRAMELTGIASPAQVASVGDTVLDLEAGHAARVRLNVGVLSGAHTAAMLATAPHTHLIASVAALPALMHERPG